MDRIFTLGILGSDISYSLSPDIHLASQEELGVKMEYAIYDFSESEASDFLSDFHLCGGIGLNVTTPHKELVSRLSASAGLASVNTLRRSKRGWEGFSTDGEGFSRGLQHIGLQLKEFEQIVFLGNGGVVGALMGFFQSQAFQPAIIIARRNPSRDEILRRIWSGSLGFCEFEMAPIQEALQRSNKTTMIIQCTSAPNQGNFLQEFLPLLDDLKGAFVDLVYKSPSILVQIAKEKGIPAQDGLPMLIEQARLSQEIWFGGSARFSTIYSAIARRFKIKILSN